MFLESKWFRLWLLTALAVWIVLFIAFDCIDILAQNWFYPAIMVVGAFVAGVTPEGGGVVAFPALNIFIGIERSLARDFSLMIQSVGMTSASIFILTQRSCNRSQFKPLLKFIPISFAGFVAGMLALQAIPVFIIQALFVSLITTFTVTYYLSSHRGRRHHLSMRGTKDWWYSAPVLFVGGICASLFGTGADIILYTLLVTQFRMQEKLATQMSIIMMASISVLGFGYRALIDGNVQPTQYQTWLCAFPVVLLMAPLGAFVLNRINKEALLAGICVLNIGQLIYFDCYHPSMAKFAWSLGFTVLLSVLFYLLMRRITNTRNQQLYHPYPTS